MSGKRVNFFDLGSMTFEKPDMETFRGLQLAYDAATIGGSMPTVYNAANEKAVSLFLDRKIKFLQIPEVIESCMQNHKNILHPTVDDILNTEAEAYDYIAKHF